MSGACRPDDIDVQSAGPWPGSLSLCAAAMSVEATEGRRTDAVLVSANRFAVADGADDLDGSGAMALEALLRLLHPHRPAGSLHRALRTSNWELWHRQGAADTEVGLAAVTVALWSGYRFVIGHVGDGRAYLVRDGTARRLTDDHHGMPQETEIGPDEAVARLGRRPNRWSADIVRLVPQPGDRLLLCTDGLWRCTSDAALAEATFDRTPAAACTRLERHAALRAAESASAVVVGVGAPSGWGRSQ